MKFIIIIFLSAVGSVSCDSPQLSKEEFCGIYTSIDYNNTVDTISFNIDGSYLRKVYDKNNVLVLDMIGRWDLINQSELKLQSCFLNLDRDLIKYPELLNDTSGGCSAQIESREGVLVFCMGYYENENCYKKIE